MTGAQLLAHALRATHLRLFAFLAGEIRREYGIDVRRELGLPTQARPEPLRLVKGRRR